MFNSGFYPTTPELAAKMIAKIDWKSVKSILDPEAGKGNILDAVKERFRLQTSCLSAIEIEPELQSILREKGYRVIDSDFLGFAGGDQFDVILMNPPFADGDDHLLKAIDVMYSGQIVCLLNAETLKNPHSNTRKDLLMKLERLNAGVDYISGAFKNAERPTGVEIALIYIDKRIDLNTSLLDGMTDEAEDIEINADSSMTDVAFKNDIQALVQRYNHAKEVGVSTIVDFFSKESLIGKHLHLLIPGVEYNRHTKKSLNEVVNEFILDLRKTYWHDAMELPSITAKLTQKKRDEFSTLLNRQSAMDFTLKNLQSFAANLASTYNETLKDSVIELFEKITYDHSYYPEMKRNILHFNGWKTNDSFKVNKRFILPFRLFDVIWGDFKVWWEDERKLNDIDKVFAYFSGFREGVSVEEGGYKKLSESIKEAIALGETKNIESQFFTVNIYKKGTIHFLVKDEDVLRRFNIMACKEKNWLPHDYGNKSYNDMTTEEKDVVKAFDGKIANYALIGANTFTPMIAA